MKQMLEEEKSSFLELKSDVTSSDNELDIEDTVQNLKTTTVNRVIQDVSLQQ